LDPSITGGLQQYPSASEIILTDKAQHYLKQAGKWASFLGLFGFVICGFVLLSSIVLPAKNLLRSGNYSEELPLAAGVVIRVVYFLIGVVYFFLSLYLYAFGKGIKKGVDLADSNGITTALGSYVFIMYAFAYYTNSYKYFVYTLNLAKTNKKASRLASGGF
jgi:hypothetical protein